MTTLSLALDLMRWAVCAIVVAVGIVVLVVGGWLVQRMEEEWRQAREERDA